MLSSSRRAKLRALANETETILQVGKGGIAQNLIRQADEALTARELIKGRVLESAGMTAPRSAAVWIADATGMRAGSGDRNAFCTLSRKSEG
jgi:RNA-binding protein